MKILEFIKLKVKESNRNTENFFSDDKINKQIIFITNIGLILFLFIYVFSQSYPLEQKINSIIAILSIMLIINILCRIKFMVPVLKYVFPIVFSVTILLFLINEKGAVDNIFIFFPIIALSVLYGSYITLIYSAVSVISIMLIAFFIDKNLFFPSLTTAQFGNIFVSLIVTSSFLIYIIYKESSIYEEANEESKTANKAVKDLERTLQALDKAYSKLRDTQTQLVQHEKMASLGMLVAGVAHEINNPIGAINCNVGLYNTLISRLKMTGSIIEDPSAASLVDKLDDANKTNLIACDRILSIVKSLRNFARLDESEYKEADIHVGIDTTLVLLANKYKNRVEIIKDYGENVPPTLCYPNQLNQIFMNLIVNSLDSIPDTGKIKISTSHVKNYIIIKIKDTGIGMSEDIKNRIFDPGFTTKGVGVGTGLGLSIVYNIIEKHNGSINVESEPGKGTEFTIKIPIVKN